jgi:hypothetical protein
VEAADPATVQRATVGVIPNGKTVTGKDGKSYPATKPRSKPALFMETADRFG